MYTLSLSLPVSLFEENILAHYSRMAYHKDVHAHIAPIESREMRCK